MRAMRQGVDSAGGAEEGGEVVSEEEEEEAVWPVHRVMRARLLRSAGRRRAKAAGRTTIGGISGRGRWRGVDLRVEADGKTTTARGEERG